MEKIEGYKVFKPDWTGYGDYQYKVGETFEEDITPKCCERGFHFCKELKDCFDYRIFSADRRVAKVEALGNIDQRRKLYCTNKIKIVEEIPQKEVLRLLNTGENNEGIFNTGNHNKDFYNVGDDNVGSYNVGDGNYGYRNVGGYNFGDGNVGNNNIGYKNSGWDNVGAYNIGDGNYGCRNTGDFNITDNSTGCFNTKEQCIYLFDKPSNLTYSEWKESRACKLLEEIKPTKWIPTRKMTKEEKEAHPEYLITGGFLKEYGKNDKEHQKLWNNLDEADKKAIKDIPNFDADIFKKCTGIDVD